MTYLIICGFAAVVLHFILSTILFRFAQSADTTSTPKEKWQLSFIVAALNSCVTLIIACIVILFILNKRPL